MRHISFTVAALIVIAAGIIISLARQEQPDTSNYNDPEIVWRMKKKNHAGLIVASSDYRRVEELLNAYAKRFVNDFLAVAPLPATSVVGDAETAPASLVVSANYEKTTVKYGDRGIRYVHLEAGHASQSICLQATALNLGAVTVGAFSDAGIKEALGIPDNESPLYVIPIGKVRD